jgi:hypothetical protein
VPGSRPAPHRPTLEGLEERTLLSTFQVVAASSADNVSKFGSLAAALGTAHAGDTIQIETGSAPGAGTIRLDHLTLQGDPAASTSALPQLGQVTVAQGVQGTTLTGLNLGSVMLVADSAHTLISNSLVQQVDEIGGTTGSPMNILHGNTVSGTVNLFGGTPGTPTGDQVVNNTFTDTAAAAVYLFLRDSDSALVQGNHFTGGGAGSAAIEIHDSQNVQVLGNVIQFNANGIGIDVESPAAQTSATLGQNQVSTSGQGTGIIVRKNTAAQNTTVVISGNDLSSNKVGIEVDGDGTHLGTIDAGGGGTSTGGNDFSSFTTTEGGRAAIFTSNAVSGTVTALGNQWGTAHPERAVFAAPGTTIQVDNQLPNPAYAFVQSLYTDFLKRAGTAAELQAWSSLLPTLGTTGVASRIIHSGEGLARLVDGLYLQYLGRAADPAGEAAWVNLFQQGATEEQVIAGLVTSAEFRAHAISQAGTGTPITPDAAYVEGLYHALLGRTATTGEVDLWVSHLPSLGEAGVADAILGSTEYRSLQVETYYTWLHRPAAPSDAEVQAWAGTPLDLMSIAVQFAGSAEFYAHG